MLPPPQHLEAALSRHPLLALLAAALAACGSSGGPTPPADPCQPNPCTAPPAPACQGDLLLTAPATGTCAVVAEEAVCDYPPAALDCAATGLVCWPGGCVLGTPATSAQLAEVRGVVGATSRDVAGALVTFAHGAVGAEPAGFYLQAEQAGPALFVALDPATTTPPLAVGDRVSFTATEVALVGGRVQVTALTGLTRGAAGLDPAPLVQALDAATGLVAAAPTLAEELVTAGVTVLGPLQSSGAAMVQAAVATSGLPAGEPGLAVRLPAALAAAVDLQQGCAFTLPGSPLAAPAGGGALLTAWSPADLAGLSCPAPRLVAALATSRTSVLLTFDRTLDAATVRADGSQFAITGGAGLLVAAAAASGRQVTLVTAPQVPGTAYTVTASTTLADLLGAPVDGAAATATFLPPAELRIDEVNANLAGGLDLVELVAESAGPVDGVVLQLYGTTGPLLFGTLPPLTVAAGDRLVVHVLAGASFASETTAKDACEAAGCLASAWDVAGPAFTSPAGGIPYTARVLVLEDAAGVTLDAVPFAFAGAAAPPNFYTELSRVQALGLWQPASCGGATCSAASTPTGFAVSVDWAGLEATAGGLSVQRRTGAAGDARADWVVAPSTWGAASAP